MGKQEKGKRADFTVILMNSWVWDPLVHIENLIPHTIL